ncbi:MAG TPA: Ppx/GppA phosphatase family protein [Solirubrobacteraceae bacterium]|nr:Ppx/GppA phosphatase family protein [Solirubrobacteraceae bacterium]
MASPEETRTAVIDLGSNTFRLVVFTAAGQRWWKRVDEIYEPVRISAGMGPSGELQPEPMERALAAIDVFAHFCRAAGVDEVRAVATSAIREATNRDAFLSRARERSGLDIQVLSRREEGFYGYVAAVNSTTLTEGAVLDLGGGSMQVTKVTGRAAREIESWRMGAVRMTERFLPDERATKKQMRALSDHVARKLGEAEWLAGVGQGERLVGLGGTVRTLAVAAEKAADLPSFGVQGFPLGRAMLDELIAELAALPAPERRRVPGIKPERADLILAGAMVVQGVLQAGGFERMEVTEAGLREGIFQATQLAPRDPPLVADVRGASVRNLSAQYDADERHAQHVAALALSMFDGLASAGLHPGDSDERELLWAAALLHDIGTTVDYDDHHRHSRYLILNAGLPGFSLREVALIAQMARYHRKGTPSLGELKPLMRKGDQELLDRCSALLRVAEQLERSRDQTVHDARVEVQNGEVRLALVADEEIPVARWAAERQSDVFERAFGRTLAIAEAGR